MVNHFSYKNVKTLVQRASNFSYRAKVVFHNEVGRYVKPLKMLATVFNTVLVKGTKKGTGCSQNSSTGPNSRQTDPLTTQLWVLDRALFQWSDSAFFRPRRYAFKQKKYAQKNKGQLK